MRILIIGAGGREHALAEAYAKSSRVKRVFVAPGNDFMEETNSKIKTVPSVSQLIVAAIIKFAKKEEIDLVDVAQDVPLAIGVVDALEKEGIRVFGPTKRASEIEWNKAWSRSFMKKYSLPSPHFAEFSSEKSAIEYIKKKSEQVLFVKASGLAAGKGVVRASNREEAYAAIETMKQFGEAGSTFLIEDAMTGTEFSLFYMCDGENYVLLGSAQDHKRAYTNDLGPNTGGMGSVSPSGGVNEEILGTVEEKVMKPFMKGMHEEGRPYKGILYVGGMVLAGKRGNASKSIGIVEFNARWGDPEAEVILPALKSDYLSLVEAAVDGKLASASVSRDTLYRVSVAGCARNYPNSCEEMMGKEVSGLERVMLLPGVSLYGAGIRKISKKYVVNGGRVFHLIAEGKNISEARLKVYASMSQLSIAGNGLFYRTDIGWQEVERGEA